MSLPGVHVHEISAGTRHRERQSEEIHQERGAPCASTATHISKSHRNAVRANEHLSAPRPTSPSPGLPCTVQAPSRHPPVGPLSAPRSLPGPVPAAHHGHPCDHPHYRHPILLYDSDLKRLTPVVPAGVRGLPSPAKSPMGNSLILTSLCTRPQ